MSHLLSQALERRSGRLVIRLQAVPMGLDWCLALTGGDRPHLGATAVAQARPSLTGEGVSASVSVITLPGHKEDLLARELAGRAAAALNANVTVCCGIHLDGITPAEIEDCQALCMELVETFLQHVIPD